jgi:hypothetical protein
MGYPRYVISYLSSPPRTKSTPDLHKTYIDDEHYNSGHGRAYAKYGVDPSVGAVVIVRPDQCTFVALPQSTYRIFARTQKKDLICGPGAPRCLVDGFY